MIFIGVDPGKRGAFAVLGEDGKIRELIPTPMMPGGVEYDRGTIALFFRVRADVRRSDRGMIVTVERLGPLPAFRPKRKGEAPEAMGGTVANFNRGLSHGYVWMLEAFGIRCLHVTPQVWQRAKLHGYPGQTTKEKSIEAAKKAWPGVDLRRSLRSRTDDDGFADALWLADYGRTEKLGGTVFAAAARTGVPSAS